VETIKQNRECKPSIRLVIDFSCGSVGGWKSGGTPEKPERGPECRPQHQHQHPTPRVVKIISQYDRNLNPHPENKREETLSGCAKPS